MAGADVQAFGSYAEAREFCDTRRARKLGNNTYLRDYGEYIAVKLHSTEIVTFRAGSVTLRSGGWQTITTKARMNCYLPAGVWEGAEWQGPRASIWQECRRWYLSVSNSWGGRPAATYHYAEGITLHDCGQVTLEGPDGPTAPLADPAADKREHRRELAAERRRMREFAARDAERRAALDPRAELERRGSAPIAVYADYRAAERRGTEYLTRHDAERYAAERHAALSPAERAARAAGLERQESYRAPQGSHAERRQELEQRIDSALAECNPSLPIYRPE